MIIMHLLFHRKMYLLMLEADPRIVLLTRVQVGSKDENSSAVKSGSFRHKGHGFFFKGKMVVSYGLVESFQQYGIYRREVLRIPH